MSGAKYNSGKPPTDLVPTRPLLEVARVFGAGAAKYRPHNWRLGLSWSETMGSIQRHLLAFNEGEDLDPETGLNHLAHAASQTMILLEYYLTETGVDDRWCSIDRSEAEI